MNSPRNNKSSNNSPLDQTHLQEQIEDYLDYLCAPLLGIASYAQRRRLRLEAADHLQALIEDLEAEGFAPEEAALLALKEYGEPWAVGQRCADTCLGETVPRRLVRFGDAATLRAFGWFGVFSVACLLGLEASVLDPAQAGLTPWVQCLAVASPLAAGLLTGLGMDSRTMPGICRAVGVLSFASAAVGLTLRPHTEVLTFAAFQLGFWLPAGCLTAGVTAALRRQFRLHRFRPTPH